MSNSTSTAVDNPASIKKSRIASIDIMRGLVIVLMLVDHVRERFYYQYNVTDPMDLDVTTPDLFFTRMTAHLCAPVFVFLTGMGAWLYAHPANGDSRSASGFLFKRGLFLVLIEVTLINFSWFGNYASLYLQVIWAIGVSMIALSVMVRLPMGVIATVGVLIVFGHNLLAPISFEPGETGYTLWAILHERGWIFDNGSFKIKASYPVLPWIGVILLGYVAGPLYLRTRAASERRKMLIMLGVGCLGLLFILRGFNIYGETIPWIQQDTGLKTLMDSMNFTKYPPSLNFLLLTIGIAFLLLAWFETMNNWVMKALEVFGSAPMFFYIAHLYVLLIMYKIVLATIGPNVGDLYGVSHFWMIWLISAVLTVVMFYPTKIFSEFKRRTSMAWVKYF